MLKLVKDTTVARFERSWKATALVGTVLPLSVILLDGATRAGYSPYRHGVSQLTSGESAWLERGTYVLCGVLVAVFATGLRRRITGAPGGLWGPLLIGAMGAGLVIAGIFPTDPALGYPPGQPAVVTASGRLHQVGGSLLFTGLIGAGFVLAGYFRHLGRRKWRTYSMATGATVTMTAVAAGVLYRLTTTGKVDGAPVGALELAAFVLGFGWLALVAWRGLSGVPTDLTRS